MCSEVAGYALERGVQARPTDGDFKQRSVRASENDRDQLLQSATRQRATSSNDVVIIPPKRYRYQS
jgi:hypothetical protein